MRDVERLLDASLGPIWSGLSKNWSALTENYTKFQHGDLPGLEAQILDYRGPIERLTLNVTGGAFIYVLAWLGEDSSVAKVEIYASFDNRVDMERFQNALDDNVAVLGRRSSSRWHGATVKRGAMDHHVAATERAAEAASVVSARSMKTTIRRWFVLNRDPIIVSLATGLVVSIAVIVLQALDMLPVPR